MAKAQARLGVLQAGAGNSGLYRAAIRQVLMISAVALLFALLRDRFVHIDSAEVIHAFGQVSLAQWIGALAATAASFWALGEYDAVVHRHLATGVPCFRARRAGIAAIAISQTLGLGLVTGSLVRWRLLPGQSLAQAIRVPPPLPQTQRSTEPANRPWMQRA